MVDNLQEVAQGKKVNETVINVALTSGQIWDNVFKNGPVKLVVESKIWIDVVCFKQTISLQIF